MLEQLAPLRVFALPRLAVPESAGGCFDEQIEWRRAVRGHIDVKPLIAELRNQQRIRAERVAMLDREHIAALVNIRRRGLRKKRIQSVVVDLLRIKRERNARRLAVAEVNVRLCIGGDCPQT